MKHPNRQAVLTALDDLPSVSWLKALAAARGVIREMGTTVMDNGSLEGKACEAIDAEILRLETTQGRD